MTEKFKKEIRHEYWANANAMGLIAKCHDKDHQSPNAASGGADRTIKQDTLFKVLADETACTVFSLTPIGYLKTIWTLFKIAFVEKKFKSGIPLLGVIFIK